MHFYPELSKQVPNFKIKPDKNARKKWTSWFLIANNSQKRFFLLQ